MAVASMKLLNIAGPMSMFGTVARLTGGSGQFQPEDALSLYKANDNISPMSRENPWEAAKERLISALPAGAELDPAAEPVLTDDKDFLIREADGFARVMGELSGMIEDHKKSLAEINVKAEKLSHFVGLSLNMKELLALEYTSVRFGRMPKTCFSMFEERDREGKMFAFKCTEAEGFTYCVIFSPKSYSKEMDRILSVLHFERLFVPESDMTVETRYEILKNDIVKTEKAIADAENEANRLWSEKSAVISSLFAALELESDIADMQKYAATYDDKFVLAGWVPSNESKKLIRELSALEGVDVSADSASSAKDANPPVKLKNSWLTRPFEMFVDMYGMPSYKDVDPTPFVAFTYIILFGVMFGDLGQGLLVSAAGFVMWKFMGMAIGPILMRCGISSAIFGCVFGSVFGFEHVLDPVYEKLFGWKEKPIEVMEPATTNMIIYAAVGIGLVLVATAMLINIFVCIKRRDPENLFFGANGLPGLVFYVSLASGLVCDLFLGMSIMSTAYILLLIVLPLILIFLKEPLGMLVCGEREHLRRFEWGNYIAQSFFELFETCLSYVTNTMSFLRVGAFVLVHAGMMMVVFTLAEMTSGVGYIAIVIIGNVIVSALEGLLVAIQVLRLEFYEMFSRFFEGGGRAFTPVGKK
ncbi:MAG: ATPase [Ruminococcaceae bacterium]|nr:ATPase [Oscillospiraceae bacterium]